MFRDEQQVEELGERFGRQHGHSDRGGAYRQAEVLDGRVPHDVAANARPQEGEGDLWRTRPRYRDKPWLGRLRKALDQLSGSAYPEAVDVHHDDVRHGPPDHRQGIGGSGGLGHDTHATLG